jgi:hypothetical protein
MIPDTWWLWLVVSVCGYFMTGLLNIFIIVWGSHIFGKNEVTTTWELSEANLMFWLWPIAWIVGVIAGVSWVLSRMPLVFLRVIAPVGDEVEGRRTSQAITDKT